MFSIFEPNASIPLVNNWALSWAIFLMICPSYWLLKNKLQFSFSAFLFSLNKEMKSITSAFIPQGTTFIIISYFVFVGFINLMGLTPYTFTCSSHLTFTLSLALVLWFGPLLWTWALSTINSLSHLVPLGTPMPLTPFMVLVELVSNLIRPITLSVRLAANMVAGHLLLTILSSNMPSLSLSLMLLVLAPLVLLSILEFAVALIQSYVFSTLTLLYANEGADQSLL